MKWPSLKNPREVRRFLGLCGTVRVWIKDYSKIIRPLTELYRTGVEFVWDERRQQAFDDIKKIILSAPALQPIDYTVDRPLWIPVLKLQV